MSCPRNIKKLWFLRFEGPHKERITHVGRMGFSSAKYRLLVECEHCQVDLGEQYASEEQMMRQGFDIKLLRKIPFLFGLTRAEDLRMGPPDHPNCRCTTTLVEG